MNVRLGWSGEIHGTWTKMDVEVDETDLLMHFAQHGEEVLPFMSPVQKFKLMYSIAETFVQLHKMSRFPDYFGKDADKKELADLMAAQKKLTEQILAPILENA